MSVRVIAPDEGNLIDLPGAGPCPRPVDIDQAVTGFARLKSLRVYRFAADKVIDGESEGDEVLIALLGGEVRMEITGATPLAADLAAGAVLYMPPGHAYSLSAAADALVAYGRASATGRLTSHLPEGAAAAGEILRLDALHLASSERHEVRGEALALVAAGRIDHGNATLGPLEVLAVPDGADATVASVEGARVWVYAA